jgi:hypothetical protein
MCTPDPFKSGPAIILWLLAGVLFPPLTAVGQATCAQEVANIQAYCKKVDRFIKSNPHSRRAFASTSPGGEQAANVWYQLGVDGDPRRGDNLNGNASVWLSQGKIVAASLTFRRESGDWVQHAMYYYREDGTLARINAQLDMFPGEMSFIREHFYDRNGVLISGSTKSCSLKSGRAKKPDKEFVPGPLPVYETTDRLPFYQALRIANIELRMSNCECRIADVRIANMAESRV